MTADARRFKVYAQGLALLIPAVTGLILGLLGFYRGGDAQGQAKVAQRSGDQIWIALRDKVNEQSKVINRLHLRMVSMQARQEERTAAQLLAELGQLQKRYDELAKRRAPRPDKPSAPFMARPKAPDVEQRKLIPDLPESYRKR